MNPMRPTTDGVEDTEQFLLLCSSLGNIHAGNFAFLQ